MTYPGQEVGNLTKIELQASQAGASECLQNTSTSLSQAKQSSLEQQKLKVGINHLFIKAAND